MFLGVFWFAKNIKMLIRGGIRCISAVFQDIFIACPGRALTSRSGRAL